MTTQSNYIVIKKTYEDGPYYIAKEEWFERIPESDTYSSFGQQISPEDAGDYLEIISQKAAEIANEIEREYNEDSKRVWQIGDTLAAYEHSVVYDQLVRRTEDGVDINIYKDELLAYTYWNGHNWATIVLEADDQDATWERVDEDLKNEIIADFLTKEWESESTGVENYKGKKFAFAISHWQGSWEIATANEL